MQFRRLGHTDLSIAPMVLGGNVFGWTADKKASFDLLDLQPNHGELVAQLGGSLPPVRLEGDTLSVQLPHPAQRDLFLQKCLGGGGEEYLFGGIDGSHDVG